MPNATTEKPKTTKNDKKIGKVPRPKKAKPETAALPDFLKPVEPIETTKQKPGPKAGVLAVKSPCPYCGEPAHRKAIQNIAGVGPLRRMYCAHGCGHYHYRHPETNEVVENVGRGPKVSPFYKSGAEDMVPLDKLYDELKKAKQALKRSESKVKQAAREEGPDEERKADKAFIAGILGPLGTDDYNVALERFNSAVYETKQEADRDWLFDLADTLGIDPGTLKFTADDGKGRPRALVNCLSEADVSLFDRDGAETIEKLHLTLLTVQACIRAYKDKAATLAKGKK